MLKWFVIYVAAAIAPAMLVAQRPVGAGGPPAGVSSGDRAERFEFIAGYLGLTGSQKAQAGSIFSQLGSASESLRGQTQAAHEELQAAIKAGRPDSELDRLANAIGALNGQGLALQAKTHAKFYALLTADQKAKFEQAMSMMRGSGGGPRRP